MTSPTPSLARETLRLLRPFWWQITLATALGMLGGFGITALLATVNRTLGAPPEDVPRMAWLFAALCVGTLACTMVSHLLTNYIGQRVVVKLRRDMAARIAAAPIEQLERYRAHRLMPVLLNDVGTVSTFALSLAPMIIAFTISVGCLAYLASLSWPIMLLTLLTIGIGIGAQFLSYVFGTRSLEVARAGEDDLQRHYQALSVGAKELRIHRQRRHHLLFKQFHDTTEQVSEANVRGANIFVGAETFGSMLFFAVIGMAIACQALWPSLDKTVLAGFVLVMLYLKGPLERLIDGLPSIGRAKVAFARIAELTHLFSNEEATLLQHAPGNDNLTAPRTLELRGVRYQYPAVPGSEPFGLGPIDLTIKRGEILFIVGENGGGKTTLIKLLLGLYSPSQGQLLLDGKPLHADARDDYRQLFTTIFADYYLFEDPLPGQKRLPADAGDYLARLDIAHKVSIQDGLFTTTDLSTGQRKRLALINAWLDERPILVFDEWAADQDPVFRRVFDTELLPELKALGKTLVVISHDDRYFHVADQIVEMQGGRAVAQPAEELHA
ncbi:cyclic peptide export ABC transporter [Pseudomonas sp. KNUC1026]|uniref:cyclic peptide export ABC transporter n=1 Tax=Pseudomonas sp. KNUC1026 TaxID=2893890 RepID=UPI001F328DFA|nr:cyclic peptide export ABC transporter [Pseudomonas sp. KNUC1026]UFH49866.1 cyclic peptide export ABC transporter [Pseudomonas sp. KNUC1026]